MRLEAKQVTIAYGAREVVRDVSIEVRAGEIVAVIGPNGAGKTSLMRALNGAIAPVRGEVLLDGVSLGEFSRRAISRRIAVVAQEAEFRFPVTVMEFVLGGRYAWASTSAWGWETEHDLEIVRAALRETETEHLAARFMNEISGGERQRAVLARALATEARILLLDEPTANLDLAHQASMLRLVRARCDGGGVSAVVVTHDINLAAEFADRIVLMRDGSVIASGKPSAVLTVQLMRQVFDVGVLIDAHPISGAPRITSVHCQ